MFADPAPWLILALVVGPTLALDLFLLNREAKAVPFRQAAA